MTASIIAWALAFAVLIVFLRPIRSASGKSDKSDRDLRIRHDTHRGYYAEAKREPYRNWQVIDLKGHAAHFAGPYGHATEARAMAALQTYKAIHRNGGTVLWSSGDTTNPKDRATRIRSVAGFVLAEVYDQKRGEWLAINRAADTASCLNAAMRTPGHFNHRHQDDANFVLETYSTREPRVQTVVWRDGASLSY